MPADLGKTLLVANPMAQRGNGAQAAKIARELLGQWVGEDSLEFVLTDHPGHATEIAFGRGGRFRTVLALGGDGVVHETVNGLMRLAADDRPRFGVIPVGSGNDYARTLGMSESVPDAVVQLIDAREVRADVGCCNGEYFAETLSFGLDAAIALDTVERRKRTGEQGTVLYLRSGIDQLLHHLDLFHFRAHLDNPSNAADGQSGTHADVRIASNDTEGAPGNSSHTLEGAVHMMAVQVGPTYGGGFRICPDARIDDGLLDICYATGPMSMLEATFKFLSAKNAHHTKFENIHFARASTIDLTFDRRPPCQLDGEPHIADAYRISVCPAALPVLSAL